jgi:hypothetical protein
MSGRRYKGGAEKEREKKRRAFELSAESCSKITDLFGASSSKQTRRQSSAEDTVPAPATALEDLVPLQSPEASTPGPSRDQNTGNSGPARAAEVDAACSLLSAESETRLGQRERQVGSEQVPVPGVPSVRECSFTTARDASASDAPDGQCRAADPDVLDAFQAPKGNASDAEIRAFLSLHPIQPTNRPPGFKVSFDQKRVFFSTLPDGSQIPRLWISYNVNKNTFVCSSCMVFSTEKNSHWASCGVAAVSQNLYKSVLKHESSASHVAAVDARLRVTNYTGVSDLLRTQRRDEVRTRRKIVEAIIRIVIVLVRQSLAFRSHRHESVSAMVAEGEVKASPEDRLGNFVAIVMLYAQADPLLREHIRKHAGKRGSKSSKGRGSTVTFLSKTFINKVLEILCSMAQETIVKDIRECRAYSLEVDSTQDVTATDQFAICFRYTKDGRVHDRLFSLVDMQDTTGAGTFHKVKSILAENAIPLQQMVGVATDGGANLRGIHNGLVAHLKRENAKLIYVYDLNHNLNISIQKAAECSVSCQDLFSLVNKIAVFFTKSHTRADVWRNLLSNVEGHEKLRRLKKIGATRWTARDVALKGIYHGSVEQHEKRERYLHTLEALHLVAFDLPCIDGDTSAEARSLLMALTRFNTTLTAFLFLEIFNATTHVTAYLQTRGLDAVAAVGEINKLTGAIGDLRNKFSTIVEKASSFAVYMARKAEGIGLTNVEIETALPEKRIRKKKRLAGETSSDATAELDAMHLYKVNVFLETANHLESFLKDRFEDTRKVP